MKQKVYCVFRIQLWMQAYDASARLFNFKSVRQMNGKIYFFFATEKFTLALKLIREINCLLTFLLSRHFCQKN